MFQLLAKSRGGDPCGMGSAEHHNTEVNEQLDEEPLLREPFQRRKVC